MTLTTRVRIVTPLNPERVFRHCQSLLGPPPQAWNEHRGEDCHFGYNPHFANLFGQGLPAWLLVSYGADGPLPAEPDDSPHPPPLACLEVSFDRAGDNGPVALFDLTARLGVWLDEQGADWWVNHGWCDTHWLHAPTRCDVEAG